MIIQSKYAGRCALCGDEYEVGAQIWWTKGEKAVHQDCHESEVSNDASPIKPAQEGTTARWKCRECGGYMPQGPIAGATICIKCARK